MAKKTVKKTKKVAVKVTEELSIPSTQQSGIITITEVPSFETRITTLEDRLDRIVTAIDKSKSVRGL